MINIVKKYGKPSNYAGGYGASASGTYETSPDENTTIDIGFKPKFLAIQAAPGGAATGMMIYSEEFSTTTYKLASSSAYAQDRNLNTDTSGGRLYSINENGFTVCLAASGAAFSYFAIG